MLFIWPLAKRTLDAQVRRQQVLVRAARHTRPAARLTCSSVTSLSGALEKTRVQVDTTMGDPHVHAQAG